MGSKEPINIDQQEEVEETKRLRAKSNGEVYRDTLQNGRGRSLGSPRSAGSNLSNPRGRQINSDLLLPSPVRAHRARGCVTADAQLKRSPAVFIAGMSLEGDLVFRPSTKLMRYSVRPPARPSVRLLTDMMYV